MMSAPLFSEHIARIRDDARRLVACAADQEDQLEQLSRAADTDVCEAEAALTRAADRVEIGAAELRHESSAQSRRRLASADATRRACVSGRAEHVAARRLLARLDGAESVEEATPAERPSAVLVADDVADIRELVASVLRDAGFRVRTAANGLEALIAAYEMQPAVIVMDMMMPVLDGIEATRLIKATAATRDARVIAYTANPLLPDILVDRLFVAVVPKPSTPDDVLAAVQNFARV